MSIHWKLDFISVSESLGFKIPIINNTYVHIYPEDMINYEQNTWRNEVSAASYGKINGSQSRIWYICSKNMLTMPIFVCWNKTKYNSIINEIKATDILAIPCIASHFVGLSQSAGAML